ncbi:MAG: helix-turn-helix transcriptional regulator [Alphaproteobacteria bacterium]|nr:helix-turn-helix transcriptional regulator [Alphaproteobacteria bacterium]
MKKNDNLILPNKKKLLSCAYEINEICLPLKKFGIISFSYTRIYDDGSLIDICNNSDLLDFFYYKSDAYKYYTPDMNPQQYTEGFTLVNQLEGNNLSHTLKEDFDVDHVMIYIEKQKSFSEHFNFSTSKNNDKILNFYLSNKDILKMFSQYFREKASPIIKEHEKNNKIIRSTRLLTGKIIDARLIELKKSFYENLDIKRFYLGKQYDNTYLTMKEAICLYWCVKGKSAEETAIILDVSRRTVEAYLNSAKTKFRSFKQTDLARKFIELEFLPYFEIINK